MSTHQARRSVAERLRALSKVGNFKEQLISAGELVAAAARLDAFDEGTRAIILQRATGTDPRGLIKAWADAVEAVVGKITSNLKDTFPGDCAAVADEIERKTGAARKRGPKRDPKIQARDEKLNEAWSLGGYKNYAELARDFGIKGKRPHDTVRKAIKRARQKRSSQEK